MIEDAMNAKLVSPPPEEILDYTIRDLVEDSDDVSFYLPYQWTGSDGIGNARPEDPLTIYWTADVTGCDERVTYKTTLGALIYDTFDIHAFWNEEPRVLDAQAAPLFVDIRNALQKEIDRLNKWIDNAETRSEEND